MTWLLVLGLALVLFVVLAVALRWAYVHWSASIARFNRTPIGIALSVGIASALVEVAVNPKYPETSRLLWRIGIGFFAFLILVPSLIVIVQAIRRRRG